MMPKRSGTAFKVRSGKRSKVEVDDEVAPSNVNNTAVPEEDCEAAVEGSPTGTGTTEAAVRPNPLENPVVLNHLFRLCTPDVLAICRQVCNQWYNVSLVIWRTTCTITFTVRRGSIFLTNRYIQPRALYVPLKKFLAYIAMPSSQCSTKPYRYIKIVDCELTCDPKQFEEFWSAMADNTTTLQLEQCEFSDVGDFRKIIFQTFPNLKRLTIVDCSFPEEDGLSGGAGSTTLDYKAPLHGEHKHLKTLEVVKVNSRSNPKLPISWLEFFSHFQSVTSFVFRTIRTRRSHEIDGLIEAIRLVRKLGKNKLPFTYFVVSPSFLLSRETSDQKQLKIVRELRLPLSALFIDMHPELDGDFLKDTLKVNAKTIMSMRLNQEAPSPLFREFPFEVQLNNLSYLGIEDKLFKNLTFLKYTPSLEALSIFVSDDLKRFGEYKYETPTSAIANTPKEEMEHVPIMERLEELTLGCVVSDEDISSLSKRMPKIMDLKMILNDKQFGIVCETWKDLKKLEVLGDKLTDKGVTGRSGRQRQAKQKRKTGGVALTPNITSLQNLEKFSFMRSFLTADSVFHGFLGLPNLKKIKSCPRKMVWDKAARNALKKRKIELKETSDNP